MSSARPYKRKPKNKKKKVSFNMEATGFNYTPYEEAAPPKDPWKSFGTLSHSEYSFMSDRSSFVASLNTISETNRWFMDEATAEDEKLDKMPSIDDPGFTFGKSMRSASTVSDCPSMQRKHTKSSRSITFSATVSLYTDSEKRQNSLLFFDLWGVPATRARSDASLVSDASGITQLTDYGAPQSFSHQPTTSMSAMSADMFGNFKQSTMVSGPIFEDDEETWSDYEIQMENSQCFDDTASQSKYRKRKSTLTNDFIFGNRKNTTTSTTAASLKLID